MATIEYGVVLGQLARQGAYVVLVDEKLDILGTPLPTQEKFILEHANGIRGHPAERRAALLQANGREAVRELRDPQLRFWRWLVASRGGLGDVGVYG
jgi:hypothetical protein